ncbi:hypothetical protein B4135_1253 [Caldibacillus debilis]|uniref:Uncharacterized protein n=1 Tax=Caldibacillus debilis TaxID=301148 RepID=A0A150MDC3_9BACI|nr:hypothetical protein B4135_1253 [Caldibacillus debilis]
MLKLWLIFEKNYFDSAKLFPFFFFSSTIKVFKRFLTQQHT